MCVLTSTNGVRQCGPGECFASGLSGWPALGRLRRCLTHYLAEVDSQCREDALLAITELVSNAAQHGGPPIQLRVQQGDDGQRLHVELTDASPQQPRLNPAAVGDAGGLGLRLVDALCTAWGVVSGEASKTVWADLPLHR
jgi:anti-sigma regulatory factor (Ser/Thr protein kinase)